MKIKETEMDIRDVLALHVLPTVASYTLHSSNEQMAEWARDVKAPEVTSVADLTAMAAYAYADAMLKFRKDNIPSDLPSAPSQP